MNRRPGESRGLVFLNIEVLTSLASGDQLDRACVTRLNHLVADSRAEIVVTSSWSVVYGLELTRALLRAAGFKGAIVGETEYRRSGDRTGEILRFLMELVHAPRIAVLNDEPVRGILSAYSVQTHDAVGLSSSDVRRARRILAARTWQPLVEAEDE